MAQRQLQLGHHSPEFTLKVYIDAFAEDLPDNPGVSGNKEATRPAENGREHAPTEMAETVELPRLVSARLVAGAES